MRLARALLFLALSGAVAHADDAKPTQAPAVEARVKVPVRVDRMLPDTHQVLVFDKIKNMHIVVAEGDAIEGFEVGEINDDEVTLYSDSGTAYVLEAPEQPWRHRRDAARAADGRASDGRGDGRAADGRAADGRAAGANDVRVVSVKSGGPQPADPYADAVAPGTIGTGADGVRVVEAPDAPATATGYGTAPTTIGTGADGIRVVEAPDAGTAAAPAAVYVAPASAAVVAPASAAVPVPVAATAAVPVAAPATAAVPVAAPATAAVPVAAAAPVAVSATAAAPVAVSAAAAAPVAVAASAAVPVPAAAPVAVPVAAAAPVAVSAAAPTIAASATSDDPEGDALAAALTGAPAPARVAAAAPAPSAPSSVVLPRTDVSAALSNFGSLAANIHATFTPTGVRVDSVGANSLFAKAGLRGGDVIASVDGKPLRSLDDAANLYARAANARNVSVAIVRGGKPATLRVTIQ